jgi:thioredoxin 1
MHTIELDRSNFAEAVNQAEIVVVDWWARWCAPCRALGPLFEAAAARYPDVVWGKVDTDVQTDLAGIFEIRSIPTVMAFREGIMVFEQAGLLPASSLDRLVTLVRALDMTEVRRRMRERERAA